MRLFTALELPANVRGHLANVQQRLRQSLFREVKVSWVMEESLHVTLKFLGEVAPEKTAPLADALRQIRAPEMKLAIDRFFCLPPRGPARVIAAGVVGDVEALTHLQREIEETCAALGFARESRGFTPHITLGRIKQTTRRNWGEALERQHAREWPGLAFDARAFVLFESVRTERGSRYVPVARFPP